MNTGTHYAGFLVVTVLLALLCITPVHAKKKSKNVTIPTTCPSICRKHPVKIFCDPLSCTLCPSKCAKRPRSKRCIRLGCVKTRMRALKTEADEMIHFEEEEEEATAGDVVVWNDPVLLCDKAAFSDPICAFRSEIEVWREEGRDLPTDTITTTFWFVDRKDDDEGKTDGNDQNAAMTTMDRGYRALSSTSDDQDQLVLSIDSQQEVGKAPVDRTPDSGLSTEVVVQNGDCTARVTAGEATQSCFSCSVCNDKQSSWHQSVSVDCSNIAHGVSTSCQPLFPMFYPFDQPVHVQKNDNNDKPNDFFVQFCIDFVTNGQGCTSAQCARKAMSKCMFSADAFLRQVEETLVAKAFEE